MSEQEHVLNEKGEFDVHDAFVDLSHHRFEDWLAFAIFWVLAIVIFYQFFTRYALNDSAGWTEEIARYLLIATVFIGRKMPTHPASTASSPVTSPATSSRNSA